MLKGHSVSPTARLEDAIRAQVDGGARLVSVYGPVGSGKMEIVSDFLRDNRRTKLISADRSGSLNIADLKGLARWASKPKRPATLVLESAEACLSRELSAALLGLLRDRADLVLILVTRAPSDLALETLGSSLQPAKLGPSLLGYTEEEIVLAARTQGIELADSTVELLLGLGGWKYAVERVLEHQVRQGNSGAQMDRALGEDVLNLAGSWLHGQVLTASAVCGFVDVTRLARVLGRPAARVDEVVEDLLSTGLLHRELPGTFIARPVGSMVEGLRSLAELRLTVPELLDLRRMCAGALVSEDPVRAVSMYLDLGDYAAIEDALRDRFPELLYAGLAGENEEDIGLRIARLPYESVADYPLVLTYQIKMFSLNERTATVPVDLMARRVGSLHGLGRRPSELLSAVQLAAMLYSARNQGDQKRQEDLAQAAEMLLVARREEFRAGERSFLQSELASSYLDLFAPEEAHRLALYAVETAAGNPVQEAYARLLVALTGTHKLAPEGALAEVKKAESLLRTAKVNMPRLFWEPGIIALAHLGGLGEADADEAEVSSAVEFLRAYEQRIEHWSRFLLAQSALTRRHEDPGTARAQLQQHLDFMGWERMTGRVKSLLRSRSANLAMFEGEYAEAEQILQGDHAEVTHPETVSRSRLRLLQGDPLGSLRLLWSSGRILESAEPPIGTALLGAVALYLAGETQQAIGWFDQVGRSAKAARNEAEFSAVPYEPLRELAALVRDAGGIDLTEAIDRVPEPWRVPYYEPLTAVEQQLVRRLGEGGTVAEAASDLFISRNTAKTHLRRIYKKLGVNSREEAVRALDIRYGE